MGLFVEKSVNTRLTTGDISSSAHAGGLCLSPCPHAVPEGRLAGSTGTESSFPARQLAPDMGADAHSQGAGSRGLGRDPRSCPSPVGRQKEVRRGSLALRRATAGPAGRPSGLGRKRKHFCS